MIVHRTDVISRAEFASLDDTIAKLRCMPSHTWLELLRDDQSRRWRGACGLSIEEYLTRLPELRGSCEESLVLICGEVQLRSELGQEPLLEEYQARFPEFAEALRLQFAINRVFDEEMDDEPARDLPSLRGYELLDEIGRGASSVVYRALQVSPRRVVAIKAISPNRLDASPNSRALREAEILANIQHPHVLRIHEAVEQAGQLFLVTEFVDGPTLAELTVGQPLPARQAAQLLVLLADAVEVVHRAGVLHRDLKPANVLMSESLTPVITDFGLAKWIDALSTETTQHSLLGTPSYMAPEQAAGGEAATAPTADVYSLGAILYELLTGRPPFAEATLLETLTAVREREAVAPRKLVQGVPRDLETIVLKALAKQPVDRYSTADELAGDLRRFLAHRPILARRATWAEHAIRWGQRNPALASLMLASITVLIVSLSGITWLWHDAVVAQQATAAAMVKAEQAYTAERAARQEAESMAQQLRTEQGRLQRALFLRQRAREHVELRRWDDALADYSDAIALRPDMADLIEERGCQYLRLQLFDQAAEDLHRAFQLRAPVDTADWRRHALLRLHVGDHAGYRQVCQQMRNQFATSGYPQILLDVVRTCSLSDDSGVDCGATAALGETLRDRFSNRHTLRVLGVAQFRARQFVKSIAACQESIDLEGDLYPVNYPILAMAQFELGRRDESRQSLQLATKAFDTWVDAMSQANDQLWTVHLGAITDWPLNPTDWLEFLQYYRQAQRRLSGAASLEDRRLHLIRARAYAALRRPAESLAEYDKALMLAPEDARVRLEAHRVRGFEHVQQWRFPLAAGEYAQAAALAPQDADVGRYLAISQLCAGDLQAYQTTCRELARRFAQTEATDPAVAVVEVCVCHHDALQNWNELLPLARKASRSRPDSPRFLAAALFRCGQYSEAVRTFAELEVYCRLRACDLFTLAMAHHHLGEDELAQTRLAEGDAWIEQANRTLVDSMRESHCITWGAWTERPETYFLQIEARELVGTRPRKNDGGR